MSMKGTRLQGRPRKSKQFDKGRTCADASCETPLSMYNKKDKCFLHQPVSYPRTRGYIDPRKEK